MPQQPRRDREIARREKMIWDILEKEFLPDFINGDGFAIRQRELEKVDEKLAAGTHCPGTYAHDCLIARQRALSFLLRPHVVAKRDKELKATGGIVVKNVRILLQPTGERHLQVEKPMRSITAVRERERKKLRGTRHTRMHAASDESKIEITRKKQTGNRSRSLLYQMLGKDAQFWQRGWSTKENHWYACHPPTGQSLWWQDFTSSDQVAALASEALRAANSEHESLCRAAAPGGLSKA